MRIFRESLASVLQRAEAAFVAEVRSVGPAQADRLQRWLEFSAAPLKVVFGELPAREDLRCRYSEGRPHTRGKKEVSPLVCGSGLEFQLKPGDRVIVLVGGERSDPTSLNVLRVEPQESLSLVESYGRAPAARDAAPLGAERDNDERGAQ